MFLRLRVVVIFVVAIVLFVFIGQRSLLAVRHRLMLVVPLMMKMSLSRLFKFFTAELLKQMLLLLLQLLTVQLPFSCRCGGRSLFIGFLLLSGFLFTPLLFVNLANMPLIR